MLHHFATHNATGPAVAYFSPTLERVILVCECTTEQQANSEAARLNAEQAARLYRPAAHYGQRRSVRHFEPDQFA
jgi:hypothetical protein